MSDESRVRGLVASLEECIDEDAIDELVLIGPPATDALIALLRSTKFEELRPKVALALGQIGRPAEQIATALVESLDGKEDDRTEYSDLTGEPGLFEAVEEALLDIGKPAIPSLVSALRNIYYSPREEAFRILSLIDREYAWALPLKPGHLLASPVGPSRLESEFPAQYGTVLKMLGAIGEKQSRDEVHLLCFYVYVNCRSQKKAAMQFGYEDHTVVNKNLRAVNKKLGEVVSYPNGRQRGFVLTKLGEALHEWIKDYSGLLRKR